MGRLDVTLWGAHARLMTKPCDEGSIDPNPFPLRSAGTHDVDPDFPALALQCEQMAELVERWADSSTAADIERSDARAALRAAAAAVDLLEDAAEQLRLLGPCR